MEDHIASSEKRIDALVRFEWVTVVSLMNHMGL